MGRMVPHRAHARRLWCPTFLVALLAAALQPHHHLVTAADSAPVKLQEKAFVAWEEAVYKAAEAALQAVSKQSGKELSLRDVPLETLQVYTGRQHQIGLSIDGIQYEVVLGSEQEWLTQQQRQQQQATGALPEGAAADSDGALQLVQSSLVRQHWQDQGPGAGATQRPVSAHHLALPDVTLSGPLELLLPRASQVAFFIPHQADAGSVRRLQLAAGVTVRVSGLRSIQLRRTLDLPSLPVGYLAEVYAHAKLQEPGDSFDKAAGVRYLANQLRSLALNSSLPLLSFEIIPASDSQGLVIHSMEEHPGMPPPRLKVKKGKHDSVELTLRQGQIMVSDEPGPAHVMRQAQALTRPWAWPLPHVDLSSLVPYEALLRSILASHPFDLKKVQKRGISLKVTKSEIRAARLMAFEMEVRSKASETVLPEALQQLTGKTHTDDDGDGSALKPDDTVILVFDVTVSVREKESSSSSSGSVGSSSTPELVYVPISVKVREVHGSTLSMSTATMQAMLMGAGNGTAVPITGYDHEDLGLAQRTAE